MLSFWEKDSWLEWDVIIIGAGIVGLSTAASILEKFPKKRVLVLERGLFPTGASTKNAGFACFGSLTELVEDRKLMSDTEVISLVQTRWEGLQRLKSRLGHKALDFQQLGGYELITEEELDYLPYLEDINALLYPLFGQKVFQYKDELIASFGFSPSHIAHLLFNPLEGQLHAGKMMLSLLNYAKQKGAVVLSGAEVIQIEDHGSWVGLHTKSSVPQGPVHFKTDQLAICTNAFSKRFLPDLDVREGRGQVLVTKAMKIPFEGVFHYQQGYYYFRNVGNRLLLGGGRNLDFAGESSLSFRTTSGIQGALESLIKEVILPGMPYDIEHRWAGIMAFGPNKQPICQKISERVFAGIRLGGMGVAIGSQLGEQLSEMMLP